MVQETRLLKPAFRGILNSYDERCDAGLDGGILRAERSISQLLQQSSSPKGKARAVPSRSIRHSWCRPASGGRSSVSVRVPGCRSPRCAAVGRPLVAAECGRGTLIQLPREVQLSKLRAGGSEYDSCSSSVVSELPGLVWRTE
jgi:hypothetical protein